MRRLILVCVFALLADPCPAGVITVDDDGPADFNNIQAASNPSPPDGSPDVPIDVVLEWTAAANADYHDIYFGTHYSNVRDCNTVFTLDVYQGRYEPNHYQPAGILELGTTYYWRIDEVNDAWVPPTWKGNVWRFATANYIVVDDMEQYDFVLNRIDYTWYDQKSQEWGQTTGAWLRLGTVPTHPVYKGEQSMSYEYDTDDLWANNHYAEAWLPLDEIARLQNWTEGGASVLALYFYGDPNNDTNDTEQMYVGVTDTGGLYAEIRYGDHSGEALNNLQVDEWQRWDIPFVWFTDSNSAVPNDVDFSSIARFHIGFGNRRDPVAAGSGRVYFDDILLSGWPPQPPVELTLLTPNGGEVLMVGSTYQITWSSTAYIGDVLIEYSSNNGTDWNDVDTVPDTGTYDWLVPAVDSSQCLVRISDSNDANISDTSDGVFTIFPAPAEYTLTINVVGSGSVSKDPDQATYTHGQVVNLTAHPAPGWSFAGWSGDLTGSTNPDSITIDGDKTITAAFCAEHNIWYVDNDAANDPGPNDPDLNDPNEDGSPEHPFDAIQKAVNVAQDGYTVIVLTGTYTGDGNRDIDFLGKAITVRSTDPNDPNLVAATVVDCNGSETEMHRGFYFHSGEDANSVLAGLTITNGYASGSYSLDRGGGIFCQDSGPTIANCVLIDNSANTVGGGICCYQASLKILDCVFNSNRAIGGGGMGILFWSTPIVTNCTFSRNSAEFVGGAISNVDSHLTLSHSVFVGNRAGEYGGAIENVDWGKVDISNCIFSGNAAGHCGGSLYSSNGPITNCTIVGNSAPYGGGSFGSRPFKNCIIWANRDQQVDPDDPYQLIDYSDVQGGWPGLGNIDLDPCFVQPGYWDPNSTPSDPNDDFWVDGDYHLLADSPCIDTGDPNYTPGPNERDLAGSPRIVDGDIDGNSVVDMGAYEFFVPPLDVQMRFTPQAFNPGSEGNWSKLHFVLPDGYDINDVDLNSPAQCTLMDTGEMIESDYLNASVNEEGLLEVEAGFERSAFALCLSQPADRIVTVMGLLAGRSGQDFCGTDTIKIINNTLQQIAAFASHWLQRGCVEPDWCDGLDLDRNGAVNFADFALSEGCCIEIVAE